MESFGQQYSESLISSLSYTLGRTSSAIVDRREAQVKPRGATSYTPRGAKTIEFTLSDSGSYALLNTQTHAVGAVAAVGVEDSKVLAIESVVQ